MHWRLTAYPLTIALCMLALDACKEESQPIAPTGPLVITAQLGGVDPDVEARAERVRDTMLDQQHRRFSDAMSPPDEEPGEVMTWHIGSKSKSSGGQSGGSKSNSPTFSPGSSKTTARGSVVGTGGATSQAAAPPPAAEQKQQPAGQCARFQAPFSWDSRTGGKNDNGSECRASDGRAAPAACCPPRSG